MTRADHYAPSQSAEQSYESMKGFIAELEKRSRFSTGIDVHGVTRFEREGEVYALETVRSKSERENKRAAKEIHAYLLSVFDKEEVDDKDSIRHQIERGIVSYGIIRNDQGAIISLMGTQVADVPQSRQHDQALCVWYVVTSDEQQGKGLALELYRNAYTNALESVQQKGVLLSAIVGEAVSEVEGYLNKMGRKRPYFTDGNGNLCEIPFPQAPIGAETVGIEPPQEHCMVRFLDDRHSCSVEDMLALIKTVFAQYVDPRYDCLYDAPSEIESVKSATRKTYRDIKRRITASGTSEILLLDAKQRAAMEQELQRQGKQLIEINA